jgi:hypothetical protein
MDNTNEIILTTFNQETESLNRIFSRVIRSAADTDATKVEFMNGMPDYMKNLIDTLCYDCCYIISLNKYLNRWRVYINNNSELIGYIDNMREKISQCKSTINNKYEFIGHEHFWYMCGCGDLDKQIEEDVEYEKYVETNEISEEFEYIHCARMFWRTNYYKQLYELDQHLHYFKTIPHKNYRDNILFELMSATNEDSVNKILEYL